MKKMMELGEARIALDVAKAQLVVAVEEVAVKIGEVKSEWQEERERLIAEANGLKLALHRERENRKQYVEEAKAGIGTLLSGARRDNAALTEENDRLKGRLRVAAEEIKRLKAKGEVTAGGASVVK